MRGQGPCAHSAYGYMYYAYISAPPVSTIIQCDTNLLIFTHHSHLKHSGFCMPPHSSDVSMCCRRQRSWQTCAQTQQGSRAPVRQPHVCPAARTPGHKCPRAESSPSPRRPGPWAVARAAAPRSAATPPRRRRPARHGRRSSSSRPPAVRTAPITPIPRQPLGIGPAYAG